MKKINFDKAAPEQWIDIEQLCEYIVYNPDRSEPFYECRSVRLK